ncbi:MAG: iron-containing alcohol dehydrogenase, partial [Muribaculaceae bacterium]|nr:iron-containing alcohol dehydrogenase [Muribaculaceae bacterium]
HAPSKPAQFARRVFGVKNNDDKSAALEGITALRGFYLSLGLPVTFGMLGINTPDIDLLVKKLHENKGEIIGGYYRLTQADTYEIYKLMINGDI